MKKAIIGLAVIALLGLACGDDEEVTEAGAATPVNVIEDVEVSFNRGDISLIRDRLSDDFVFHFDPRDVGRTPPGSIYIIPESWPYIEFLSVLWNMYNQAYAIELSINTSGVGTPGGNDTTYQAENVKISLLVMVTEINGFIADGGYCNFAFERYDAASGDKYWRLTGWWDHTSEYVDAYPGASPSSIGRVLAAFK